MKKIIFSILFCVVLISAANNVFACKGRPPKPAEDQYNENSAIFSGKVISVRTGKYVRKVKIRIEKDWKNNLSKTITVSTPTAGSLCGYNFVLGKKYLIYADGENLKNLSVNICSRTALLSEANEDLEVLKNLPQEIKSSPK